VVDLRRGLLRRILLLSCSPVRVSMGVAHLQVLRLPALLWVLLIVVAVIRFVLRGLCRCAVERAGRGFDALNGTYSDAKQFCGLDHAGALSELSAGADRASVVRCRRKLAGPAETGDPLPELGLYISLHPLMAIEIAP
jgi:hypothetical protein